MLFTDRRKIGHIRNANLHALAAVLLAEISGNTRPPTERTPAAKN